MFYSIINPMKTLARLSGFSKYAWGVLIYNLGVILWGAYVRASGSGAGCGSHWPLCNGQVIPRSAQAETMIEFAHRLSSGLVLPLVLVLAVWAWRIFSRGNAVRVGAGLAVMFTVTEALVGAGLVLFGLTAENDSLARAYVMMIHLANTFLLLAMLTLTAWWSMINPAGIAAGRHREKAYFGLAMLMTVILGASGAVAALGDTLFPVSSLSSALRDDFSPSAHILVRLRVLHPVIAVITGLLVSAYALWLRNKSDRAMVRLFSTGLLTLIGAQIGLGMVNVILLAPVWMQLIHLLVADLIWMQLVLLAAIVLSPAAQSSFRLPEKKIRDRIYDTKRVGY